MVEAEDIKRFVAETFSGFSHSKRRELARLTYEIARKEKNDYREIIAWADDGGGLFTDIRERLIRRRYPNACKEGIVRPDFPELEIDRRNRANLDKPPSLLPQKLFIEKSLLSSPLAHRIKRKYPDVQWHPIASYREHTSKRKPTIQDYNRRLTEFYIVRENYDFFKRCACSPKSVYCGYHVINLGSGCGFDCSYCYLQDYLNSPGIVIPGNIEDFFERFERYKQDIRIGSGELTDSLIFDHITGYSCLIVDFFKKYPKSSFEFKTKSDNIANLLKVEPGNNIVISWSMNPAKVIERSEHFTASLEERLNAAITCTKAGYKIAFHFDPMIHYEGWESDYKALVDQIFDRIDSRRLAWISIGTLRMTTRLKKIIENRFEEEPFLNAEYFRGYDGKLRYAFSVRAEMYKKMKTWLTARKKDLQMYLCMEEKDACGACDTGPLKQHAIDHTL